MPLTTKQHLDPKIGPNRILALDGGGDQAVGDMKLDSQSGAQLATYVRYNAILEQAWLKPEIGVDLDADELEQIRKMDDPSNMNDLADLGRKASAKQVKPEHLPATFDLAKASV